MRPTVEYKGWKVWGPEGLLRHTCPYKISIPGNYTTESYERDGYGQREYVHVCNGCGTRLPKEVKQYFQKMHNLLNMSKL